MKSSSSAKAKERQVLKGVRDFLIGKGWRAVRQMSGMFAQPAGEKFRVGEPGMPDYQFIWYFEKPYGACLLLWVEFKRQGVTMNCRCTEDRICTMHRQIKWRAREEARKAKVVQVSGVKPFIEWYDETFRWLHTGERAVGQMELPLS